MGISGTSIPPEPVICISPWIEEAWREKLSSVTIRRVRRKRAVAIEDMDLGR
jgi:hypothetical protein